MIVLPDVRIESDVQALQESIGSTDRLCHHDMPPGPVSMHASLCPDEASLVIGFSGLRWTTRALFPLVKLQHLYLRVA